MNETVYTSIQLPKAEIELPLNPWKKLDSFHNDNFKVLGWNITFCRSKHSSTNTTFSLDVTSFSPSEQIIFVRKTLSLNMSQLAELIGVTRPTAYAWLDERGTNGETSGKIMQVAVMVQEIKKKEIPRVDLLAKRPIFDGKSLLDLMKECKDISNISDKLNTLKKIGDREEKTRRNKIIQQTEKNPSRINSAIDELSTPIYFEEPID